MFGRFIAVAAGLATAATLAAAPQVQAQAQTQAVPTAASVTSARLTRATVSRIHWHRCAAALLRNNGMRCGHLKVPLDYRHPHGRKITLALTIRKHTSSKKKYLGPMLVNPGGPGGSGRVYGVMQDWVPDGVGGRFDWIGFDPRGVGASKPALHCDTSYFGYDRPDYVPAGKAAVKHWKKVTTKYAKACKHSKAKRLLPYLTTRDSVRDMNSIRKALGVKKISFYGFSYGTYLAQVYLTMFPKHAKRFVLDGVVNPKRVWYGANLDQDKAFDSNMDVYWKWVAAHDSSFHLGTSWTAIKSGYYAELKKLAAHPAAGGKLGPDELADAMLDAGYYVYGWTDDANAYAALINDGNGQPLLNSYTGGNVGAEAENGYAIYDGVQCIDEPWPGWVKTLRDSRRVYKTSPFETWGNTWYNAPCINWPAKSHYRARVHQRAGTPKFLLLSETKDAATPYSGALEVRSLFPRARLIAGIGGTTHAASLSGVGCTDNRVARYLATGKVPPRKFGRHADVRCPHLKPSEPGSSSRVKALPPLRTTLMQAQHWSLR
ncbi:MAG TPA: alpha/beta hydrolase [Marmoricola sp.]